MRANDRIQNTENRRQDDKIDGAKVERKKAKRRQIAYIAYQEWSIRR